MQDRTRRVWAKLPVRVLRRIVYAGVPGGLCAGSFTHRRSGNSAEAELTKFQQLVQYRLFSLKGKGRCRQS